MITCKREHLAARCRQRGYTLDEVSACIVSEDGDQITVDEAHSAYPRAAKKLSMVQKVRNFTEAAVRHVAAGMPMATDGEVARRYAICMGCEFMKDGACTKCGCPLVREKKYISKLSWADSECPVGKWGKEKLPDGQ